MEEEQVKDRTLERASEEYLKLCAYVSDCHDGELIKYEEVERLTGIPMTVANKTKLRSAILRSGKEILTVIDVGYQLPVAADVPMVLGARFRAVDSRLRRAEKALKTVQHQFFVELPPEQRKGVLFFGSMFGIMRHEADKAKQLRAERMREQKKLSGPKVEPMVS